MKYDITERTFLVEKYLEKKSIVCVQREWRKFHDKKNVPGCNTIRNIVKNVRTGRCVTKKKSKPLEPIEKRKDAKIAIENLIKEFPTLSIRKNRQCNPKSSNNNLLED